MNGSYDPNHIQLLETSSNPQFVYDLEVEGNETWYTYRVEFQNTGTAPAQTVVVTDLLPNFFDFSTVVPVEFAVARRVRGWFVFPACLFVRQWVGRGSIRNSSV